MSYSKAYIQTDLLSQEVPDSMIRHAENVNMSSSGPFKGAVGKQMSLDDFSVNEPENRTSNLSSNRPNVSSEKYKVPANASQRVLRRNSGLGARQGESMEEKSSSVLGGMNYPSSPSEKSKPPMPNVSQLHNFKLQK